MAKVPPGITKQQADARYPRVDAGDQGLTPTEQANVRNNIGGASKVVLSDAQSARTWIRQGAGALVLASVPLKAVDVPVGSTIRIGGVIQFYTPAVAGKGLYIVIGGVSVAEISGGIGATAQRVSFFVELYVKANGTSVLRAQSQMGQGSANTTDGTGSFFGVNTSGGPTSATVNMLVDNTLDIRTSVGGSLSSNGEWHELQGFTVEVLSPGADSHGFAPAAATACWGDSLTIGSGAVLYTSDYPSVLAKAHPGTPVYNGGVGGEKSGQILNRILADKIRGRHWTCVFWMGRNNTVDAGFQSTVLADIASAVANLSHSRYLILTVLNATTEDNTTQRYADIVALNNAILAAYPNNSFDIRSFLATEPNGTIPAAQMSDTIHLNASGYQAVETQVNTFLAGKGWI